jgi:hypothetical protein
MMEIKRLTGELYARLGVSSMPRSRTAKLLERIDEAAEELDRVRRYALRLERQGVAQGTIDRLRREERVSPEMLGELS